MELSVSLWILFLALSVQDVGGLELNEVVIPEYVLRGQDFHLACLYDLQGKELYSIKWYKDGKEFYRYEPSTRQTKKHFPQPGVKVDLTESNATHVRLRDADLRYAGRYMCEVSTEAPSFASKQGKGQLHVLVLPAGGPVISGGRARYEVGDRVKVNCTSHRSKPAARLLWYINGQLAPVEHLHLYPPVIHEDGLDSVTVGLHFRVRQRHFREGRVQLKCVSQLPDLLRPVYWQSREQSADVWQRSAERSHVLGASLANKRSSSRAICHEIANWVILAVGVILAR